MERVEAVEAVDVDESKEEDGEIVEDAPPPARKQGGFWDYLGTMFD